MFDRPKRKQLIFSIIFIACLLFALITYSLYAQSSFFDATVKEIPGPEYKETVIELLDRAAESIAISMYNLSIGGHENDPIKWLLGDLLEARERGVEVTLYINTNSEHAEKYKVRPGESSEIKKLKEVGCIIHLMPEDTRLHDRLIVVDSRYVVEFETLIDSPGLAEVKMRRFENFQVLEEVKTEE